MVGSPPIGRNLLPDSSEHTTEEDNDWVIPYEELEIGRRLGIGSYGEVFRAQWRCTDVAVKRMTNITESHMEVPPPSLPSSPQFSLRSSTVLALYDIRNEGSNLDEVHETSVCCQSDAVVF